VNYYIVGSLFIDIIARWVRVVLWWHKSRVVLSNDSQLNHSVVIFAVCIDYFELLRYLIYVIVKVSYNFINNCRQVGGRKLYWNSLFHIIIFTRCDSCNIVRCSRYILVRVKGIFIVYTVCVARSVFNSIHGVFILSVMVLLLFLDKLIVA